MPNHETRSIFYETWIIPILKWLSLIGGVVLLVILFHQHTLSKRKELFTTDLSTTFHRKVILSEKGQSKEYRLNSDVVSEPGAEQIDQGTFVNEADIETVYWPNGGVTTFDDCQVDNYNVGHPIECQADNGEKKSYQVELLQP